MAASSASLTFIRLSAKRSRSVTPSTYSITMQCRPSPVSTTSWITQTFGCDRAATARASCSNRRRCLLSEKCGQKLERNSALQPSVLGEVNFAHPTCSEWGGDLVVFDRLPGHHPRALLLGHHLRRDIQGRRLDEIFSLIFIR